jgi:hypothetical protein
VLTFGLTSVGTLILVDRMLSADQALTPTLTLQVDRSATAPFRCRNRYVLSSPPIINSHLKHNPAMPLNYQLAISRSDGATITDHVF